MTGGGQPPAGPQRVAALLLSLDPEAATRVLSHLEEDVVAEVAQAMIDLDPESASPATLREVFRRLAIQVNGPREVKPCDARELTRLLSATFGSERADAVIEEIQERRRRRRPFLDVEGAPPSALATVLREESPAVAALVLAHLDPALSAAVLGRYPQPDAIEVVRRVASLSPPPHDVLLGVARDLRVKVDEVASSPPVPEASQRLQTLANLLNHTDPELERGVLEALQEEDGDVAAEIREHMFTWDDIGEVDKRSMQKILGSVDTKTLSMALKASSPAVERNILSNLSARVREMVAEERDMLGAVPMADVAAAREEIMRSIRALIEAGEFRPGRAGEDLVS